jgi:glycerol-3-phosphate dehydrogenase subunit B
MASMTDTETITYDVCIIGAGMTGMAAALFAANRGLSTIQAGGASELQFASGLLDLLGVHPIENKKTWRDPWAGINALTRDLPQHPYARIEKRHIQSAFDEFLIFLGDAGVAYKRHKRRNQEVVTSMGTSKLTYCLPLTMWKGAMALKKMTPCLIVDFRGLKGFSARQIGQILVRKWPNVSVARVKFPGLQSFNEIHTERIARALETAQNRERLAQSIRPHIKGAEIVGLPTILGINRSVEVMADLERRIGIPLFEIPTMPPSVAGLRLKEAFEKHLPLKGVNLIAHQQVLHARYERQGFFVLDIGDAKKKLSIRSRGVILATGRFIGQGLHADRLGIRETIFNLPVHQPESRAHWHAKDFLDPKGHPLNRAGLEVDNFFRPLDKSGKCAFTTLFAAGSILAHQDWIRMKCGSGLAVASAYAAVNSLIKWI